MIYTAAPRFQATSSLRFGNIVPPRVSPDDAANKIEDDLRQEMSRQEHYPDYLFSVVIIFSDNKLPAFDETDPLSAKIHPDWKTDHFIGWLTSQQIRQLSELQTVTQLNLRSLNRAKLSEALGYKLMRLASSGNTQAHLPVAIELTPDGRKDASSLMALLESGKIRVREVSPEFPYDADFEIQVTPGQLAILADRPEVAMIHLAGRVS